jgi:heme exporter protein D
MMALGPHAAFIVAAYLITAIVLAGLIAWVVIDHRAQARALADLDARGVRRRSETAQAKIA